MHVCATKLVLKTQQYSILVFLWVDWNFKSCKSAFILKKFTNYNYYAKLHKGYWIWQHKFGLHFKKNLLEIAVILVIFYLFLSSNILGVSFTTTSQCKSAMTKHLTWKNQYVWRGIKLCPISICHLLFVFPSACVYYCDWEPTGLQPLPAIHLASQ